MMRIFRSIEHVRGCVGEDTLRWASSTAVSLPPTQPSLLFVHIPVPQFMTIWNVETTYGSKQENVACPLGYGGQETYETARCGCVFRLFASSIALVPACSVRSINTYPLVRRMGIGAIYSGHDHDNDYFGSLNNNIRLAYGCVFVFWGPFIGVPALVYANSNIRNTRPKRSSGTLMHGGHLTATLQQHHCNLTATTAPRRKTGYGSYGPPKGWQHGARVIVLRQGEAARHSQTWLRLEDGSRQEQQASRKPWWSPFKQYVCAFL